MLRVVTLIIGSMSSFFLYNISANFVRQGVSNYYGLYFWSPAWVFDRQVKETYNAIRTSSAPCQTRLQLFRAPYPCEFRSWNATTRTYSLHRCAQVFPGFSWVPVVVARARRF
jgi:hypothetical protein